MKTRRSRLITIISVFILTLVIIISRLFYLYFEDSGFLQNKGKLKLIRSTGIIEITYDNGKKFKRIDAKDNYHQTSHFGADIRLLKSYINYLKNGKSEVSAENGIKSLKIIDMINKSIAKRGKLIENKIKKY